MLGVYYAHRTGIRGKPSRNIQYGIKRREAERRGVKRRGAILVLAAMLMVVLLMVVAFSVDLGIVASAGTDMKRATDAAALAGAGVLIEGAEAANLQAFEFMVRNPVGNYNLAAEDDDWKNNLATLLAAHQDEFETAVGHWDAQTRTFVESDNLPSTIRVAASRPDLPLFFAKIFGHNNFTVSAESIAQYQPRDIAIVLDFSGSMNDDSELKRIDSNGNNRTDVENSLHEIYEDMGPMSYGNLQFQPRTITLVGVPPESPQLPQITVEFRSSDVFVNSSKDLSNVVMEFSDGTRQKIEDLSSPSGAFCGTGYNYNKRITKVWVKSGDNESGDGPGYGEKFEDDYTTIKNALDLTNVPYPYPSGSWDNYIYYVKTSSSLYPAGYRRSYGYMTLINYWLEQKSMYSQTPDLWKANAQPVGAVKNAVGVFMEYIQEVDTEDRVALVVYNSPSQEALVEHSLTEDFAFVEDTVVHRQAGHYDSYTNIGDGIRYARQELDSHARLGAFKMIVLMTDGIANRPYGVDAAQYAKDQAALAKEHGYPIVTISLGSGADIWLMQSIADITSGKHFNIPGMSSITDYHDDLLDVFREIANDRPLILVK